MRKTVTLGLTSIGEGVNAGCMWTLKKKHITEIFHFCNVLGTGSYLKYR
jgi:hypothetical protein